MKVLEVIVTSAEEAREAESGGASRLELVSALEQEGLTPALETVREVLASVSIPVRVMVRDHPTFSIASEAEFQTLRARIEEFSRLPVNGLVLGFVKDGRIDAAGLSSLLDGIRVPPVTFHRAIEAVNDPISETQTLRSFPLVDRILTSGGEGSLADRQRYLEALQEAAGPGIRVMAGGGVTTDFLEVLSHSNSLSEFHVGRAARDEAGRVRSTRISALRRILDNG
jgi:copper homeostasis protein